MREMHTIQVQREKETLEKIKLKVERIKANQRKFEPNLIAAKSHQEGTIIVRFLSLLGKKYFFSILAVRYNGKYLYEELVEKTAFDPRQNESIIESEESFLLRNNSRFESSIREPNASIRNESRSQANESRTPNETGPSRKILISF